MNCPKCEANVPLEDINVAKDAALCRKCGQGFSFAELLHDEEVAPVVDLDHPPKGMWFHRTPDGFELGSTTRSAAAIFLVPFMCIWSGGSLGGIYGSQIAKGDFNLGMSLFGLPFLAGTVLIGSLALMSVCGKVCVRAKGLDGEVFAGVRGVGFRRRFKWDQVKSIRQVTRIGSKGRRYQQVRLEVEKDIAVATSLSKARMDFFVAALRQLRQEFLPVSAPGAKPPIANVL